MPGTRSCRFAPVRRRAVLRTAIPTLIAGLAAMAASTTAAHPAQALFEGPNGAPLYLWSPAESWEGGSQADPRLDRIVSLWRAGRPLAQVFAEVSEQTTVALRFYPEGDVNAALPVNVFLHTDHPPTLRELMVQLAWAIDSSFCYEEATDGNIYYLLSTSVGQAPKHGLAKRRQDLQQTREHRLRAIEDKLAEYRLALELSEDELVRRYRGRDDLLLLNLLDPARRAAVSFICRHLEALLPGPPGFDLGDANLGGFGVSLLTRTLSEEDRADLGLAFGLSDAVLADPETMFDIHVEPDGRVRLMWSPESPRPEEYGAESHLIVDVTDDFSLSAGDEIALRKALGETIGPAREAEIEAAHEQRARGPSLHPSLSADAAALLSSLTLGHRPTSPAWRIQEAVAKDSGMHVVSDGLLWRPVTLFLDDESPAVPSGNTALGVLETVCSASAHWSLEGPAWEWGDAGPFLRFRTSDRDVLRGARLPDEFIAWLDGVLGPLLPDPEDILLRSRGVTITLSLDPAELAQRLGELSETQIRHGWLGGHGEPTQLQGAARQAALEPLLEPLSRTPALIQFLGTLDDSQWERLRGPGLKSSSGLTPDQREALPGVLLENSVISPTTVPAHETLLELGDKPQLHGGPEPRVAPVRDYVLRVTRWMMLRDQREISVDSDIYLWPTEVTVSLELPAPRGTEQPTPGTGPTG